jgi:hypothetical protein
MMTRAALLLAVLAGAKVVVSGSAEREQTTYPCKGGVHVSEEMIQHQTQLLRGAAFTFYAGDAPTGAPRGTVKTNAEGKFSIKLAPGRYCVVQGEPPAPPAPRDAGVDSGPPAPPHKRQFTGSPEDMEEEPPQPTCDTLLDVPAEGTSTALIRLSSSNKCPGPWNKSGYRGPMPP